MRLPVGILGSGNIGTDLMYKIGRSSLLQLVAVAGIAVDSEGLSLAKSLEYRVSAEGIEGLLRIAPEVALVFDATSARAHVRHAEILKGEGIRAIDLTPAGLGPGVCPVVNQNGYMEEPNVSLVSCGGQATIPIVHAMARVGQVRYAEIVSAIASKSAGPGTRQNIDEFTRTTARGLVEVGGAGHGKAIIILNPAEPPLLMRNTVFGLMDDPRPQAVRDSLLDMVNEVQRYVPGYQLQADPIFDGDRVTVLLEVKGAGDYLPVYAGNLDIMTSAAVRVAESYAEANVGQVRIP